MKNYVFSILNEFQLFEMLSWRNNLFTVEFRLLADCTSINPPLVRSFAGRAKGSELIAFVCSYLKVCEYQYFGLLYQKPSGQLRWLNEDKAISRQFKSNRTSYDLFFQVKFYVPNPDRLEYEATRYQFYLQAKRDIYTSVLTINDAEVLAKLFALILQAELGNYSSERDTDNYSSMFNFIPLQGLGLELRAQEIHKTLKNICPGEAEWRFLREVKNFDFYGIKVHTVFGEAAREFDLGIYSGGVYVFYEQSKRANYLWSRMNKIERNGAKVSLFVRGRNVKPDVHVFRCSSKDAAKHLFDCANQHKEFFVLNNKLNDLSEKFLTKTSNESQVYSQLESSLKFERLPMKRYPKRRMPDKITYINDQNQGKRPKGSGLLSGLTSNPGNRQSVLSMGSRGMPRSSRTPRNRVAKYYVPRVSAGSDSEALASSSATKLATTSNLMRHENVGLSVPISRKQFRLSAINIDDASDIDSNIVMHPDMQKFQRFQIKSANSVESGSVEARNQKRNEENEFKTACYQNMQGSQSSQTCLKSYRSRLWNPNNDKDAVEYSGNSDLRLKDLNMKPKSPLPTYEQHMSSHSNVKRSESAKQARQYLESAPTDDDNGNILSPILPYRVGAMMQTRSAVNVKPNSSSAKVKKLNKDQGTSKVFIFPPNSSDQSGAQDKENIAPRSSRRHGIGELSTEGSDSFQVSSTPCSPKTRSVRSFLLSDENSKDGARLELGLDSGESRHKKNSNAGENPNFHGTADTSGFERSTFTVYL
ncbi:uncharacterized protein LOC142337826 [Convolutriloba macropyga]|uniref:uncharacterized protein LOC142337826 n=1 Tax=Convolutriloba macropyga TaxID=536237 RepID=UPI003F525ACD